MAPLSDEHPGVHTEHQEQRENKGGWYYETVLLSTSYLVGAARGTTSLAEIDGGRRVSPAMPSPPAGARERGAHSRHPRGPSDVAVVGRLPCPRRTLDEHAWFHRSTRCAAGEPRTLGSLQQPTDARTAAASIRLVQHFTCTSVDGSTSTGLGAAREIASAGIPTSYSGHTRLKLTTMSGRHQTERTSS